MIRKLALVVTIVISMAGLAKAQTPSSAFTLSIYNDTCAPVLANKTDSLGVNLSVTSYNSSFSYTWTFNPATIPTQYGAGPTVFFHTCGTYTITLTAKNPANGLSSQTSQTITIKCKPTISFTPTSAVGCNSVKMTLTGTGTGCTGTSKFSWLINSQTFRGSTVTYTFPSSSGTTYYPVTLTDSCSNGCVTLYTKDTVATVSSPPVAYFSATPANGCAPAKVSFINMSTGSNLSYQWSFPSGSITTSTATNPTVTYTTTGTFAVTLIATNTATGCSDTLTLPSAVTVNSQPVVTALVSPATVCSCGSFNLSFSTKGFNAPQPTSGTWSSSPTYSCSAVSTGSSIAVQVPCSCPPGSYTFTGVPTYTNGCTAAASSKLSVTVKIAAAPTAFYTSNGGGSGCAASCVTYTAAACPTAGVTYTWSPLTGNTCDSIIYNAATPCQYGVCYKCFGIPYSKPTLTAVNTASSCSATYTDTGQITISQVKAAINVTPDSTIFNVGGCAPKTVTFHSNRSTGSPTPNKFSWSVIDSATGNAIASSSGVNDSTFTYTFTSCTPEYIKLVATNSTGCSGDSMRKVVVGTKVPGQIVIKDTIHCYHDTVSLRTYTKASCPPLTFRWSFVWPTSKVEPGGNFYYVGGRNVRLDFLDTGYHHIALETNNKGCLDTVVNSYRIHIVGPKINYNVHQFCGGEYDSVVINTGPHTTHSVLGKKILWSKFNTDSVYASLTNDTLVHFIHPCGTYVYQVRFFDTVQTVEGLKACVDSLSNYQPFSSPIVVYIRKLAMSGTLLTKGSACAPDSFKLHNTSDACGGIPDFGFYYTEVYRNCGTGKFTKYMQINSPNNRNIAVGDIVTGLLSLPGIYKFTICGIVNLNGARCTDSIRLPDSLILHGIIPNFKDTSLKTGCKPLPVTLRDSADISCGLSTPVTYKWEIFAPNTTTPPIFTSTSAVPPTFNLIKPGCYGASYIIRDNYGCSDTTNIPNYACVLNPGVSFTLPSDSICGNVSSAVTFTPVVTVSGGAGNPIFTWKFGDGDSSNVVGSVTHTYTDSSLTGGPSFKTYNVCLTVKNGNCDSTYCQTIYVTFPKINIKSLNDSTAICPPLSASIVCTKPKDAVMYTWNYASPNPSAQIITYAPHDTISPVYRIPGIFTVTLTVITKGGCTVSASYPNYIKIQGPTPIGDSLHPKLGCAPLKVHLYAAANGTYYEWQYGDGSSTTTPSNSDTISYTYTTPGTYIPRVILIDKATGCAVGYPIDTVRIATPFEAFSFTDTVCSGQTVQFKDLSISATSIVSRKWKFGDGSTSTSINPTHVYVNNGNTVIVDTVRLSDVATLGCTDSIKKPIYIYPTPKAKIAVNDSAICPNNTVTFIDTSTSTVPITTRTWYYGIGARVHNAPTHVSYFYTTPAIYTASLVITNAAGCVDSVTQKITVYTPPPINAGIDTGICIGTSAYPHATGGVSYVWHYHVTDSTIYNPVVTPTVTTTYYVHGIDKHGCFNNDSMIVTVNKLPTVSITPGPIDSTCRYMPVILTATGFPAGNAPFTFTWSPASGLSATTGATINDTPNTSGYVYVVVKDKNKCLNYDTVEVAVKPLPPISGGPNKGSCLGTCDTLIASGGVSYVWKAIPPAATVIDSTDAMIIVCPQAPGLYTYTVKGYALNGCSATQKTYVTINPPPTITINDPTKYICLGKSTLLTAAGAVTYTWTPNIALSSTNTASTQANPTITTEYKATGVDAFGCINSDSISVVVVQHVVPIVDPSDTSVCDGKSVQLSAHGGLYYLWKPANGLKPSPTDSTPVSSVKNDIEYQVYISNLCFTDSSQTVEIHILPDPTVVITPHFSSVVVGQPITLSAQGYVNNAIALGGYMWLPLTGIVAYPKNDSSEVTVVPQTNTTYLVIFTLPDGCAAEDSSTISLICSGDVLLMPNIFTPQSSANMYFKPISLGVSTLRSFRIYDRWGALMYSTTDAMDKGWDGTHGGSKADQGVYVYYIEAECANGQTVRKQGNVTLLR